MVRLPGNHGIEASEGGGDSGVDAVGFFGVGLFEGGEAFAEAGGVFVGDGEDSDAALGAAGMADEVMAAALVGVGYGGVYDLDEGGLMHGRAAIKSASVVGEAVRLGRGMRCGVARTTWRDTRRSPSR